MKDYTLSTQEYKFLKGGCLKLSPKSKHGPNYTNLIHMDYTRGCIVATDGRQLRWVNSRDPQPDRDATQFDPFVNIGVWKRNSTSQIVYDQNEIPYPDYKAVQNQAEIENQTIIAKLWSADIVNFVKTLQALRGVADCDYDGTHGREMITLEFNETLEDRLTANELGAKARGRVKLTASVDKYNLTASATFPVEFETFQPVTGDTFRIAVNVFFLADILADIECNNLVIRMEGELAPLWIESDSGMGALLMPVRLPRE